MKTSVASFARTNIGCVAVLMGMMGIVTEAAAVGESNAGLAGKRGLSPIIMVDANHGITPTTHTSHGDGMNFDLSINASYLTGVFLTSTVLAGPAIDTSLASNPIDGLWHNQYATALAAQLPNTQINKDNFNYQINALYDFLALYSVTRNNGAELNGWDDLPIANGDPAQKEAIRKALFGDGTASGSLINSVAVGGSASLDQNPLTRMGEVLSALGVPPNVTPSGVVGFNIPDHYNHFHLNIKPPTNVPVAIVASSNLLAAEATMTDASPIILAAAPVAAQEKYDAVYSVCKNMVPVDHKDFPLANGVSGASGTVSYFMKRGQQELDTKSWKITLLDGPKHGKLVSDIQDGGYMYHPEAGYLGIDQMTFVVEAQGKKFKEIYSVHVGKMAPEYGPCPDYGVKELPGTTKGGMDSSLNILEMPTDGPLDVEAFAKLHSMVSFSMGSGILGDGGMLNIADLPGGAVGQTTGEGANANITLDTNAAGNNWFIDTTPGDNSEFLPTSNPYEWVAKAGSAAEGKMDMLSVLLHEYGHALGIEHSADSHDYMATTLTPGVRRMPSAEELALMQQLIGVAKGEIIATSTPSLTLPLQGGGGQDVPLPIPLGGSLGLAFLGRLRNSRYGGTSIDVVGAPTITQYAVAANAAFTNLNTTAGWNTQGSVDIAPSTGSGGTASATLNEVSTSQTRLSQVFMLKERDRYLSFTLSGAALDNLTGAPDDAFEVALLDANTGASLLGGTGLTRSDAFLNLQSDGTQNAASCVTCINNADGSRTYRVDLTGIAAGTVANLSFDLLGFGASNSHVTLSDIRVSGLPQLHDDAATLAEDNLLTFDPFAQADSQLKPLLASHIVAAPTHGVLAVNADGTFSYTPDLNYFGADSFSYRLSDGPLDSNLATVSLTVTPVNDAPVAADVQAATAEDTALVIALGLYATDVDSTTLTPQIVTGPAHGVLTQNSDGSYSYTPSANYNGADSFTYKVNDGALDSNIATVTLAITSVNDAPQGLSTTVTTLEDTDYVFQLVDFDYSDVSDAGSNAGASNFSAVTISSLPLVGTLTNNGIDVVAGQSISVADIAFGLLKFAPAYNANGAGYASFTFQVQDDGGIVNGGVDRDPDAKTITLDVTPVNDAPVAVSATVTGLEDTPYIFYWNDFRVSDVDSADLAIIIDTLPVDGLLQHYDGIQWTVVLAGQRITKADIDAGYLCFGPDANESGFDGYGTAGTGNRLQDYASFTYQADDGFLSSAVASMTIDIVPLADTPALMLSAATDEYGATATRFHTSWETASNYSPVFTILPQSELEGWNVVRETGDTGQQTFILWSSGDKMKDANNTNRIVTAAPNNGNNWLEIGNAMGLGHQTYGIERTVDTRAGVTYNLSLDYAGRLGYGIDFTCIGIYVDGVQIATYAGTSPNTALNWEALNFSFTGTGTMQTIRIVTEAVSSQSNGRGAMIDNIVLTEYMPINTGYQDSPIRLSAVIAALIDTDGSEVIGVTVGALPTGAMLTDGTHSFTATDSLHIVVVTDWNLANLSITAPAGTESFSAHPS